MDGSFFRKEVLDAKTSQRYGQIRLRAPKVGWVLAVTAVLLLALAVAFLALGTYVRRERLPGSLVPDTGLADGISPIAGTVSKVYVRQGDHVTKGTLLAEVSGELEGPLGSAQQAVVNQIANASTAYEDDLEQSAQAGAIEKDGLRSKLAGVRAKSAALAGQIAIQKERIASASELYEKWLGSSASGVVSKSQLLQQKDTLLQGQAQMAELLARQAEQRAEEAQIMSDTQSNPLHQRHSDNETRRQMADLARAAASNAATSAAQVRATTDGVVTTISLHTGQHVGAGQSLLTVLPDSSRLVAEFWVSPAAIGLMKPGTAVRLRYDTYPYQRYGMAYGSVSTVSSSALVPDEVERSAGTRFDGPRYRVDVTLARQDLSAGTENHKLVPGMTLSADFILGKQRIFEALFDPLRDVARPTRAADQ